MSRNLGLVLSGCVIATLASAHTAAAQSVPLVFQTTFNCPEWNQSMGLADADVCNPNDDVAGNGGWTTSAGSRDQITAPANNPAGAGGRGFRHWVGDGVNNTGGGIRVDFPSGGLSEMWFRYYIRFESGFRWGSPTYMKTIYCNRGQPGTFYFGIFGTIGGHVEQDPTGGGNKLSSVTWSQWQGGSVGDGRFHSLEVHVKMNSTGSSSDGVMEFWLNGAKIYSNSNIHFADTTGARFIDCAVGENHNNPQNGRDVYVDFDDIAVSGSGYIGPTYGGGAGPVPPPAAPTNVRILP
jgi:hypothetical protein